MADWVFSTGKALEIMAVFSAIVGAYQLIRGFGKFTNGILALVAGVFVFSFLTWASSGGSLNLAGLLRVTVVRAVPHTWVPWQACYVNIPASLILPLKV